MVKKNDLMPCRYQRNMQGGHCPPIPLINWCVGRTLRKTF